MAAGRSKQSRTVNFEKHGIPEACVTASHDRPTCGSMVRSTGSSRCSTSTATEVCVSSGASTLSLVHRQGLPLVHFLAQPELFLTLKP